MARICRVRATLAFLCSIGIAAQELQRTLNLSGGDLKLVRELVLDDPAPFVPLAMNKRGKEIDYEAKTVMLAGRRYVVCRYRPATVVAAGVFPPFLLTNAEIVKDASMAVAFISAFSICFFYRTRGLKIPFIFLIIAMGLIIYGALVRTNGIFAAVPLFVYLVYPVLFWQPIYFIVVSLALIAIWIPAANLFNHQVLRALPTNTKPLSG